jgi:hypothetical protein
MKISGASIDELPEKLRPLMEAFTLSPIRVAPEREAELLALLDEHGVGVHLKLNAEDWLFEEFRMGRMIFVGTRTLERLWAYCYGYTAIITELQKADGVYGDIGNKAEYELGFYLLDWAKQETIADREGEWPDNLPDPRLKGLEHVPAANHFFLMTAGRLLLHEFAHTVCNHSTSRDTPSETIKAQEIEADAWADSWILSNWQQYKDNENVFIGRCLGIAFAHAPTLIFGFERDAESPTHPAPMSRILAFIDRWIPNGNPAEKRLVDLPCAFLLLIAGHALWQKQRPFEWEPLPKTYHDLFMRLAPHFH